MSKKLDWENITITLNNEEEVVGIYKELTQGKLVIMEINTDSLQTIPIHEIKKITDKNHLVGSIVGLGTGILTGH